MWKTTETHWETNIPQGRGVYAPVCYAAPCEHDHGLAKKKAIQNHCANHTSCVSKEKQIPGKYSETL